MADMIQTKLTSLGARGTQYEGYHSFINEQGNTYGCFEVFWFASPDPSEVGWYWHACFPGCLPDGEPAGPFQNSKAAYDDAQEQSDDE